MRKNLKGLILVLFLMVGCTLSSGCEAVKGWVGNKAQETGAKGADHLDAKWVEKMEALGIKAENYDTNKNGVLELNEQAYFTYALHNANKERPPDEREPWWVILVIGLLGGAGTMTPMRRLYVRLLKMIFGEAKSFVGMNAGVGPQSIPKETVEQ